MSLDQIKEIVKISGTFDLDFSDEMDEYLEKVYEPVRAAVADNDAIVIEYLSKCGKNEIDNLITAVRAGALEGKNKKAAALYVKHSRDMGDQIDNVFADLLTCE